MSFLGILYRDEDCRLAPQRVTSGPVNSLLNQMVKTVCPFVCVFGAECRRPYCRGKSPVPAATVALRHDDPVSSVAATSCCGVSDRAALAWPTLCGMWRLKMARICKCAWLWLCCGKDLDGNGVVIQDLDGNGVVIQDLDGNGSWFKIWMEMGLWFKIWMEMGLWFAT